MTPHAIPGERATRGTYSSKGVCLRLAQVPAADALLHVTVRLFTMR